MDLSRFLDKSTKASIESLSYQLKKCAQTHILGTDKAEDGKPSISGTAREVCDRMEEMLASTFRVYSASWKALQEVDALIRDGKVHVRDDVAAQMKLFQDAKQDLVEAKDKLQAACSILVSSAGGVQAAHPQNSCQP